MKKTTHRKLFLNRETVRTLRPRDHDRVGGGQIVQYTPGCISRTNSCGDTVYLCTVTTCLNCA